MSYATLSFSDLLQVGCLSGHPVLSLCSLAFLHPCFIGMLYAICLINYALQSFVLSGFCLASPTPETLRFVPGLAIPHYLVTYL